MRQPNENRSAALPPLHGRCPRVRLGRYGGIYVPSVPEDVDPKPEIEKKCAPGCATAWDVYKKCESRIEQKVSAMHTPSRHSRSRAQKRSSFFLFLMRAVACGRDEASARATTWCAAGSNAVFFRAWASFELLR